MNYPCVNLEHNIFLSLSFCWEVDFFTMWGWYRKKLPFILILSWRSNQLNYSSILCRIKHQSMLCLQKGLDSLAKPSDWYSSLNHRIFNCYVPCAFYAASFIISFFLLGRESHCWSSMWCDGPDNLSMWWSQQTSCNDVPGMHISYVENYLTTVFSQIKK